MQDKYYTMIILNIETSTSCCSTAITINGMAVASRENLLNANHASELPLFVDELLKEAKQQAWHLDAVALSQGPGSYTGLRIGASLAKGLCYGLNIPLLPIDTLQVLCASLNRQIEEDAWLCRMMDTRRMEVYTALYSPIDIQCKGEVEAKIIDETAFHQELSQQKVYFFGNGSDKCIHMITHPNAQFISGIVPQAKYMGGLAEAYTAPLDIKELAYYEPFYLKEFVATPSHVKGLK